MTKRELIDEIVSINRSASPRFLAQFDDVELDAYLAHLSVLKTPRLSGDAAQYEKYFRDLPTIQAPRPAWRVAPVPVSVVAEQELPDPMADDEPDIEDQADEEVLPAPEPDADEPPFPEDQDPAIQDGLPDPAEDEADDAEEELDEAHESDLPAPKPKKRRARPRRRPAAAAKAAPSETPLFAQAEEESDSWLY
jgi:hypothetical protein